MNTTEKTADLVSWVLLIGYVIFWPLNPLMWVGGIGCFIATQWLINMPTKKL